MKEHDFAHLHVVQDDQWAVHTGDRGVVYAKGMQKLGKGSSGGLKPRPKGGMPKWQGQAGSGQCHGAGGDIRAARTQTRVQMVVAQRRRDVQVVDGREFDGHACQAKMKAPETVKNRRWRVLWSHEPLCERLFQGRVRAHGATVVPRTQGFLL